MAQLLRAIYRNGAFVLHEAFDLPEGAEVELIIQPSQIVSPPIFELEAKQQFLKALVERMRCNPIPVDAPSLERDMLHERR